MAISMSWGIRTESWGLDVRPGGKPSISGYANKFSATNVFWRQIRNFVIDMTAIPATSKAMGIHWPTAQATSLQNIVFKMSSNKGTQHQGMFIEEGRFRFFQRFSICLLVSFLLGNRLWGIYE